MFVFTAISLLATTVYAQYGGAAAAPPASSNPGYYSGINYPPPVYDSYYWDYDSGSRSGSREHRRGGKRCPDLKTYLGYYPGVPDEAFYPPVIRYARFGREVTALVVCDKNVKNFNVLFGRFNSSRDIREAHIAAAGTTAGLSLTCDRRERKYEGSVIDSQGVNFTSTAHISEFTCLGLDKTPIGIITELLATGTAQAVGSALGLTFPAPVLPARKKRDTGDETTVAAEETTAEAVTVKSETTEAVTVNSETTDAVKTNTAAPSVSSGIESINLEDGLSKEEAEKIKTPQVAIQVALGNLVKLINKNA